jgi:hypothetical protein
MTAPDPDYLWAAVTDRARYVLRAGQAAEAADLVLYIRVPAHRAPTLLWGCGVPAGAAMAPSSVEPAPAAIACLANALYATLQENGVRHGWWQHWEAGWRIGATVPRDMIARCRASGQSGWQVYPTGVRA